VDERSKQLFDELEATLRDLPDDRREQIMAKLECKTTFRVPEVADLLDMSETTVRRKLRAGDLPGVKLDKSWRVSRAELARWWREKGGGELFDQDLEGGGDE
jgi:excisionase family DNA binding protein